MRFPLKKYHRIHQVILKKKVSYKFCAEMHSKGPKKFSKFEITRLSESLKVYSSACTASILICDLSNCSFNCVL